MRRRKSIVSKVKTGLNSFKDFKLPITDQSVAGYVALHKRVINIRDVYDDKELESYSPQLNFLKAVDTKTGYRTQADAGRAGRRRAAKDLIGVVQIINSRGGRAVPAGRWKKASRSFARRSRSRSASASSRGRRQGEIRRLVANAVISAEELELARARRGARTSTSKRC